MSLFKLLFKFNPSKLKVIPAERMSMQMREQISEFLDDISKRITKGDYDVTPGQLQYLKDQGDEITRMDMILADRAARNKQGVGSFMKRKPKEKPSAEVVDFPKTPKPPEGEPFAFGGRVGYAVGGLSKGLQALVKQINKRFGKGTLKTADEIDRPESAKTKQAIEDFEARNPDPKRQLTDDEIDDLAGEVGELDAYDFDGTVESANRIRKEYKDYMDDMYQQYKAGKLGSKIGDDVKNISDTEIAKAYKQAREGNDLDLNDNKYDAQIISDYLSNNLYKTDFYDLPKDAQLDIYDKSLMWLMDDKMEKAMRAAKSMKGPIDTRTGKNIITGEKVMDVDYIPGESPLPKKRTLNANGGLATLFMER